MKPRFRVEWEVSSEELCILASWFLSPMSMNAAWNGIYAGYTRIGIFHSSDTIVAYTYLVTVERC